MSDLKIIIKPNKSKTFSLGFTLIELLIVISIIGILVALAVFGFGDTFKNARDTQRKSDLKSYQTAIERYANNNDGYYPNHFSGRNLVDMCSELGIGTSPASCDEDPVGTGNHIYRYRSNSSFPTRTSYTLYTKLENVTTDTFWVICSDGRSGEHVASSFNGVSCPF